mmetsp:Transcript_21910/g.62196  ORF Transcript_21910/g.62196 Transcript_21910/m.62196 type:complete len:287 (-) Transcript_21910:11-871(-)
MKNYQHGIERCGGQEMPPHVQVGIWQPPRKLPQGRAVVVVQEPAHHSKHKHDEPRRVEPLRGDWHVASLAGQLLFEPRYNGSGPPRYDDDTYGEAAAHQAPPSLVHRRVLLCECYRQRHRCDEYRGRPCKVHTTHPLQQAHSTHERVPQHRQLIQKLHGVAQRAVEEHAAKANDHDQHGHQPVVSGRAVGSQEGCWQQDQCEVGDGVHGLGHPVHEHVVRLAPVELCVGRPPAATGPRPPQVVRDPEGVARQGEAHEHCQHGGGEPWLHTRTAPIPLGRVGAPVFA